MDIFKETFFIIDTKKTGYITEDNLFIFLNKFDKVDKKEVIDILNNYGDEDKKISLDKYIELVKTIDLQKIEYLDSFFELISDKDKKYVDSKKFVDVLSKFNFSNPEKKVKILIKLMSVNCKPINKDDLINFINNFDF